MVEVLIARPVWTRVRLLPANVVIQHVEATSAAGPAGNVVCSPQTGHHEYLTRTAGRHTVKLNTLVPYSSSKNSGITLAGLPTAPQTTFSLIVKGRSGISATVEPSTACDVSALTEDGETHTWIRATIAPGERLSARWTAQAAEELVSAIAPAPVQQQPLTATVDHQAAFSLGEGVLLCDSTFTYDVRHGTMACFDIAMDPRLRVVGVSGSGMKVWTMLGGGGETATPAPAPATLPAASVEDTPAPNGGMLTVAIPETAHVSKSASSAEPTAPVLRVTLEQGVEGRYELVVESEVFPPPLTSSFHPLLPHFDTSRSAGRWTVAVDVCTHGATALSYCLCQCCTHPGKLYLCSSDGPWRHAVLYLPLPGLLAPAKCIHAGEGYNRRCHSNPCRG